MTADVNQGKLGMKWYKFLIYFALIAGAVVNFLSAFSYATGAIYEVQGEGVTAEMVYLFYGNELKVLDILYGVYLIVLGVFGIIARQKLAKYKPDAPKFLYITYVLVGVGGFIYTVAATAITGIEFDITAVVSLAITALIILANVNYFNKRAHLFNGEPQQTPLYMETPNAPYGEAPNFTNEAPTAKYCRSCGSQLPDGAAFCQNCGAPTED